MQDTIRLIAEGGFICFLQVFIIDDVIYNSLNSTDLMTDTLVSL